MFQIFPVLSIMEEIYMMPKSRRRFQRYLSLLQDKRGELVMPIMGYNPMAKPAVLARIRTLMELGAEDIMSHAIDEVNRSLKEPLDRTFQVALNVVDDIGGAWSHRFVTNYDNRFKLQALIIRDFCTPYVWISEEISESALVHRTQAAIYRTLHWLAHGTPKTLNDHIIQEKYAIANSGTTGEQLTGDDFEFVRDFYERHSQSEDYNVIFNFLFGDRACADLGYATYGMIPWGGIHYINSLK